MTDQDRTSTMKPALEQNLSLNKKPTDGQQQQPQQKVTSQSDVEYLDGKSPINNTNNLSSNENVRRGVEHAIHFDDLNMQQQVEHGNQLYDKPNAPQQLVYDAREYIISTSSGFRSYILMS